MLEKVSYFYFLEAKFNNVFKDVLAELDALDKLSIKKLPILLQTICRLESILVSGGIFFKKISIMPKGQSPKLKARICNIPISEIDANCITILRPADRNGVIAVKLKRKVECQSLVLFEPTRPSFANSF